MQTFAHEYEVLQNRYVCCYKIRSFLSCSKSQYYFLKSSMTAFHCLFSHYRNSLTLRNIQVWYLQSLKYQLCNFLQVWNVYTYKGFVKLYLIISLDEACLKMNRLVKAWQSISRFLPQQIVLFTCYPLKLQLEIYADLETCKQTSTSICFYLRRICHIFN